MRKGRAVRDGKGHFTCIVRLLLARLQRIAAAAPARRATMSAPYLLLKRIDGAY
jgi:hypothetical protein